MRGGQAVAIPAERLGTGHEVERVEPEVMIAQPSVAVPGRPANLGWEGLGGRFARYLIAATLSFYGDWLTTVALVVLLYRLSGPVAPAGYMLARVLPRLLSAQIGGSLADRSQPQHVVAACACVQAAFTVSIVPSARMGLVWPIYGAVAIAQFAGGLARPAVGALVPRVAPPQRLQRANAMYSLGLSSSVAVGPAIAAPLLPAIGAEALLIIDTLTFVVAAGLMLTLPRRGGPASWSPPTQGAAGGMRAVWRDPVLRTIAAAWACSAISATAAGAVLVLIAGSHGNASSVGYLYAAMGACAVVSGFVIMRRTPALVSRDLIVGFAIVEVLGLALLTIHGPFWAACLAIALSGGTAVVWQTVGTTDMQLRADPGHLGRVNAVMVVAISGGMLVGALLALALVPLAGWDHALFIACCLSLVVLALGVVLGPQRGGGVEGR